MKQFDFPSSSGPKIYHTLINDNGLLSCDCPGWTVKKLNKVRECKHTKKVAADEGLTLEERDGQMFVVSAGFAADVPKDRTLQRANVPVSPDARLKSSFIAPMLASVMPEGKTADSFNSDWVMEEKFDGHRIIVRVDNSSHGQFVHSWSRLGNVRTLPDHIRILVADLPTGVYDGELIVPSSQHSYSVTAGQSTGLEALVLFDMLEVQGESIMGEPFGTRHLMLEIAYDALSDTQGIFPFRDQVFLARQQSPVTMKTVEGIWGRGGEGAIIKKLSGKYNPGWRSPDWIKVKQTNSATLTIIGFVTGKNGPYSVVKLRDDHGIETTAKTTDNAMMRLFAKNPNAYIGKRVVINFQEKMPSGKYRHPMLERFAGDRE